MHKYGLDQVNYEDRTEWGWSLVELDMHMRIGPESLVSSVSAKQLQPCCQPVCEKKKRRGSAAGWKKEKSVEVL